MRSSRTLVLLVVTPLLLAAWGCSTNPATGRRQLIMLSDSELDAIGAQAAPELTASYGGEIGDSAVRAYVAGVGDELAHQTEAHNPDLQWQFTVLDTDVINAFALPGGRVFISRGLLQRLDSEAEMAGVLGHEVGHVTANHVGERLSDSMIVQFGLDVFSSATEYELAVAGASLLGQGFLLKFGRDDELEADSLGLRYMTSAGYDPASMLSVMEVLASAGAGGDLEIFSTHPHPETRMDAIRRELDERYAGRSGLMRNEDRYDREVLSRLGPAPVALGDAATWCALCRAE